MCTGARTFEDPSAAHHLRVLRENVRQLVLAGHAQTVPGFRTSSLNRSPRESRRWIQDECSDFDAATGAAMCCMTYSSNDS